MNTTTRNGRPALAFAALALGATTLALAAGDAPSAIEARQDAMENVGASMKVLGAIARGRTPFSAETAKGEAGTIAAELEKAAAHFPAGSDKGNVETWAKPEIWSDSAAFAEAMKAAQSAARALQAVSSEEGFRPALGQLGEACKGCHERFRRPKQS